MADITITPANVAPGTKALTNKGISGGVINAGDVVAKTVAGKVVQADSNDTTPNETINTPVGIATCSTPGANQTVLYVTTDNLFSVGGATVPGTPYFLSANPGKICEPGDLASGMRVSLIGFGATSAAPPSTANFILNVVPSGQTM